MKKIYLFLAALLCAGFVQSQTVSDFEDLILTTDSLWIGADYSGGFQSGNANFLNSYSYDPMYGPFWSGFAYTNIVDTATAGSATAIAGKGYNGSANYGIASLYGDARVRVTGSGANKIVSGFYITNSTYTYISMRDGDFFGKKFGGPTGTDPDWFMLTVKGYNSGSFTADTIDFYLADFRSDDSTQDYLVKDWQWVDLTPLGNVDSIQFFLRSSDVGQYGMNTPAYFALDNFTTTQLVNVAPIGYDETVSVNYITDTLLDVTANDFDTTSTPLRARIIAGPVIPGATAKDSAFGIFYSPAVGIVAVDTIIYAVCDGGGLCDTATVFISVTSPTGVNEIANLQLVVSPNPFSSQVVLSYSNTVERIKLYDIQGRELRDIRCNTSNSRTVMNNEDLPQGLYFVRLLAGDKVSVTKLIKQ